MEQRASRRDRVGLFAGGHRGRLADSKVHSKSGKPASGYESCSCGSGKSTRAGKFWNAE
jgi:hypothetical protein